MYIISSLLFGIGAGVLILLDKAECVKQKKQQGSIKRITICINSTKDTDDIEVEETKFPNLKIINIQAKELNEFQTLIDGDNEIWKVPDKFNCRYIKVHYSSEMKDPRMATAICSVKQKVKNGKDEKSKASVTKIIRFAKVEGVWTEVESKNITRLLEKIKNSEEILKKDLLDEDDSSEHDDDDD